VPAETASGITGSDFTQTAKAALESCRRCAVQKLELTLAGQRQASDFTTMRYCVCFCRDWPAYLPLQGEGCVGPKWTRIRKRNR
jgi:hypothetical protein